jgi:hypothetical protein
VTIPLVERRRLARHRRALGYWAVLLGMYASLFVADSLAPAEWLHYSALFAHLGCVILGLGAAVTLEFHGVLWMTRRRSLDELRQTERAVSALAWLGIVGLLASGTLLQPNLADPLTLVKLIAVLVVALNGVAMTRLTAELNRMPPRMRFSSLPRSMQLWCLSSAVLSQAGWWTAVLVGMLNTATR